MGGGPLWPFNEHKILHLDNEKDILKSLQNYEESGYDLDLDLLTILDLRPIYLTLIQLK